MDQKKEIEKLMQECNLCVSVGDSQGYEERRQQISELTRSIQEDKREEENGK